MLTFNSNLGAIFSVTTLLACIAPTMKFHLYGIIPIPAWLVVSGLFGYDLYATLSNQVFFRFFPNLIGQLTIL